MSVPTFTACCGASTPGNPAPSSGWLPVEMRRIVRNEACPGFGFQVCAIGRSKTGSYNWAYRENDCGSGYPMDRATNFYKTFSSEVTDFLGRHCTYTSTCPAPATPCSESSTGPAEGCFSCIGGPTCTPTSTSNTGDSCTASTSKTDLVTPADIEAGYSWIGEWADDPAEWSCSGGDATYYDRRGGSGDGSYYHAQLRLAVKLVPDADSCFPIRVCVAPITIQLKAVFNAYTKDYSGVESFVGPHEEPFSLTIADMQVPDADWHAWSDVLEIDPDEGVRLEFVRVEVVE